MSEDLNPVVRPRVGDSGTALKKKSSSTAEFWFSSFESAISF